MQTKEILIAIHHIEASYSTKWIEYCKDNGISYKLVNCYESDIVEQLKECDALLWNWNQSNYKAQLFARGLMTALDRDDFIVYPNSNSGWHYDDKVGQKYLLESINAPLVKSYAFYDKKSSLEWANRTEFPKVFKLRNGAGSHNVQLIKDKNRAIKYINQAFAKGFQANHRSGVLKDRWWHFQRDKTVLSLLNVSRGIFRFIFPHKKNKELPRERNYIYAQNFIPDCDHDIRVFVIGNRAVTKKRMVRDGDFRASGSGKMTWDIEQIPVECVRIAFQTTEKLGAQSVAFDFVMDNGVPKIVEISYAASEKGFPDCPGYWNRDLSWTKTPLRVEYFILEDVLDAIEHQRY